MKILLLEPFFTGSHASWATAYATHSRHEVQLLTMSGHYWKWRMHGGAVTLGRKFLEGKFEPDLILATDMLDVSTFLSLTRTQSAKLPVAVYFHENQLTYPWSPTDEDVKLQRDSHYSFINFTSALSADAVYFNSDYHLQSFTHALPVFLKSFPDYHELAVVDSIYAKSKVLYLGMDLKKLDDSQSNEDKLGKKPLILWNHRWEYDKNPEEFFQALNLLADQGMDFDVVLLGQQYRKKPTVFKTISPALIERIVFEGFEPDFGKYAQWLWKADILPVTSQQDFFGGSTVQAMYCNTYPLLPDRLAFPEHIPVEKKKQFIYQNFDELLAKLKTALMQIEQSRAVNVQQYVQQYDWSVQAPLYDAEFEELANNFTI